MKTNVGRTFTSCENFAYAKPGSTWSVSFTFKQVMEI